MLSGPGWRRPRFSGLRWVKPEIQSRRSRGRRVARKDGSGDVYYYFEEPVGRTRTMTGATGVACNEADYYLFGGEQSHGNTCDQNYHFAGMYRDGETGNDYTQFRMYESNLGRWMTPDPVAGDISNPQSLNRYAYVVNNPTNLIDPLGLFCYRGAGCPDDAGTVDYLNDFDPMSALLAHAPSPGSSQGGRGRRGADGGGAAGGASVYDVRERWNCRGTPYGCPGRQAQGLPLRRRGEAGVLQRQCALLIADRANRAISAAPAINLIAASFAWLVEPAPTPSLYPTRTSA